MGEHKVREKEKMKRKSNTVFDQAKVEKRRKRNREAAKKCREKKNAQIAQLEAEKEKLKTENKELQRELDEIKKSCETKLGNGTYNVLTKPASNDIFDDFLPKTSSNNSLKNQVGNSPVPEKEALTLT